MKQNKPKYRIVHVVDDILEGTFYKVQERQRHLIFFHWWSDICHYRRYRDNGDWWLDCRYKTYDDAKNALERYKENTDFYYQKTVYEE